MQNHSTYQADDCRTFRDSCQTRSSFAKYKMSHHVTMCIPNNILINTGGSLSVAWQPKYAKGSCIFCGDLSNKLQNQHEHCPHLLPTEILSCTGSESTGPNSRLGQNEVLVLPFQHVGPHQYGCKKHMVTWSFRVFKTSCSQV